MSYEIRVLYKKNKEPVVLSDPYVLKFNDLRLLVSEATINITYNYAKWFQKLWPAPEGSKKDDATAFGQMFGQSNQGIRSLYGRDMNEIVSELDRAINTLRGRKDGDYWKPTQGNAKEALKDLRGIFKHAMKENPGIELTLDGD